ncbi:hypothetical protein MKW94_000661 [Papaver nudicaule]|uniref:Uncharacterized protein n=1 Tax=Papaver nudicaule TaxID=74823 RepID=A0AA41V9D0_PAPNU|nr:hypothetical protein [Papaver nudicaule]
MAYQQPQSPKYDCLLFDLDDCLYPFSSGMNDLITKNVADYMHEKLGIEESKIPELGNYLYKTYGTSMAGIRAIGYEFDYDEYHRFVHGKLPYENLKPDPVLRSLLLSLPYRKVIFTNADKIHAAKALSRLGLEDCFGQIICFETLNPPIQKTTNSESFGECNGKPTKIFDIAAHFSQVDNGESELPKSAILCKPAEAAFEQALKIADINPKTTIFFDDSTRNIASGKRAGLTTVLVGKSQRCQGADYALESIHNIREVLPELWGDVGEKKSEKVVGNEITIETSVIA